MDKQQIIDYVMNTPGNTNPNVLRTLLDENNSNKFFVTLTLTSDSGGTMDKSNAEIAEAFNAGKTIYFAINFNGIDCVVQATLSAAFEGFRYPSFNAYGIDTSGTTITNLYVNPADEESYSFTMDAVEIGGSGGGVLVVTDTNGTLDKTWQEIHDAMLSGGAVVAMGDDARAVANAYMGKSDYGIDLAGGVLLAKSYSADSASGYPSRSQ